MKLKKYSEYIDIQTLIKKLEVDHYLNEIDELILILYHNLEVDIDMTYRSLVTRLITKWVDNVRGNVHNVISIEKLEITSVHSFRHFYNRVLISNKLEVSKSYYFELKGRDFIKKMHYIEKYFDNLKRIGYDIVLEQSIHDLVLLITNFKRQYNGQDIKVELSFEVKHPLDIDLAKKLLSK